MNSLPTTLADELATKGWTTFRGPPDTALLTTIRASVFTSDTPGQRCLLDHEVVRSAAAQLRAQLIELGLLPESAVAIQAIAFDKTATTNWKVTWHQDLMFPFAKRVRAPGYDLATTKDGIHYARPPEAVLAELLAVRLHLDVCDATNGPLRVSPASHREGILKSAAISAALERRGTATCLVEEGDVLVMKPLLLHSSSPATAPKHRRVLHLVFHAGSEVAEPWYRAIS